MVNWFTRCWCFPLGMSLLISRPLHWIQPTGVTSVSITKPDVMWSAFNAALSHHQVLIPLNSETKVWRRRSRHKRTETRRRWFGFSVCLNIVTPTFQPLRRPPELSSRGAAAGLTAVVHSRHLGGFETRWKDEMYSSVSQSRLSKQQTCCPSSDRTLLWFSEVSETRQTVLEEHGDITG